MWHHLKKTAYSTLFFLFIGPILLVSSCVPSADVINVDGSSSMYALFQNISNNYEQADIAVRPNGSASGIKSVLEEKSDFGNVSHSLASWINSQEIFLNDETYQEVWKRLNIKTVTVGWDPVVVLYKKTSNPKEKLFLTSDNILTLYRLFAGSSEPISYHDFYGIGTSPIHAFSRTGGAVNSGTANAFLENSGLITKNDFISKDGDTYQSLYSGKYNTDGYVTVTGEPNVQAYNAMVNSNKPYVMCYFSAGFVYTNWNIIGKDYDILGYQTKDKSGKDVTIFPSDYVENPAGLIASGYKWFRSFNTMMCLPNLLTETKEVDPNKIKALTPKMKKILNFAYFIATGKTHNFSTETDQDSEISWYTSIWDESGVIRLSDQQKAKMFKNQDPQNPTLSFNDFLFSDVDLGYAGVPEQAE